jgi:predicted unusual protein kinase regulating ubiquinone biosynthesis (AarF/ABC1/UbiB family)
VQKVSLAEEKIALKPLAEPPPTAACRSSSPSIDIAPSGDGAAQGRPETCAPSASQKLDPLTTPLSGFGPPPAIPPPRATYAPRRPTTSPRSSRAAQRNRFIRAYWTTYMVIGSYLLFSLGKRFFGAAWGDSRIADVHERNARRVERTIVKLQGLFIKVGQLLSIMANFLPEQFRSGLEALQDQVPPRPYGDIEARIKEELGMEVSEIFERFCEEPIASASLGQVHEAWLKDGTHVAVKVQHRDIDEIVRLDLSTIRRIMQIVGIFIPVQGLDAYYHQIRVMISEELDFIREVRNINRIADNFLKQPTVRFPRPVERFCTRRVMVTTFVEGVKVGDVAALDALGIDRRLLAKHIVKVFCQQIFIDGIYHADPHPGNMLVGLEGELILLDFGAVAELSSEMREGIPEFLEAVIRRDTDAIIKALRKMGFLARTDSLDVSERVIEFFHQRFQEEVKLDTFNLKDIKLDPQKGIESLVDLRKMNIGLKELSGAFHVPRDFVLLERTILLLTGVCTQLDPEMSPMDVVRPYLQEFVLGNRDWAQIAFEAAKDMGLKALTLPEHLGKFLTRANRGEAEIRVRGLGRAAGVVYAGIRQLIFAALGISAGFAALELYLAGHLRLAQQCLYGACAMGVLLLGSMLLTRTR